MWIPSANLFIPVLARVITVRPGSMVGRLASAEVCIQDPHVSEAHALVSLRGSRLKLLALRGSLMLEGAHVDSVILEQGQLLRLTDTIQIFVEDVTIPSHTLMLCGAEDGPVEASANIYSIISAGPTGGFRLTAEFAAGACGHLWYTGGELWISLDGNPPEQMRPGRKWNVRGRSLYAVELPLTGILDTSSERDVEESPRLIIRARYTSVHILRSGQETAVITGKPAALLTELVRFGGKSVSWEVVAREIWKGCEDRILLRQNWDRALGRLREQLRTARIRTSLVAPDGAGNIEMVLVDGDELVDES